MLLGKCKGPQLVKQSEALSLLKMGENVFLTGAAGTGKTYLLNQYIHYLKQHQVKVAITASTGIAATHISGVTLHAWSGIGMHQSLSAQILGKILTTKRIVSNYKKTKVLIIDEISMLHAIQLDMVDTIARNILDKDLPFGGIQVVLCGDFFQLPPVKTSENNSDKLFAFEADAWQTSDFKICYLTEQHRQINDPLLTVLNDIRSGQAGEHTKVPLRTRYKKEPAGSTKATLLYARNMNVDAMNELALSKLTGIAKIFTMTSEGPSGLVKSIKKSCLAHEQLTLKIAAEVMFIKNDMLGKFANGTRGVVIGFDKETGYPMVRLYNDRVLLVVPESWNYEENNIIRASVSQIPLRLAWAITIHKSQGMTLDCAEMNLSDTFEPGMGYVALSRVRSLSGLKLLGLNEMALKVHPHVLKNDHYFQQTSQAIVKQLHALSEEEKEKQAKKILVQRFKGVLNPSDEKSKPSREKTEKILTHTLTHAFIKDQISIAEIALKRMISFDTVISHIEKLKGLKQIKQSDLTYLTRDISPTDFDLILTAFRQSEDGKLKPVYEKFDGKYAYDALKIVRLFV